MMSIIVCLSMLVSSFAFAEGEAVNFHACSQKYPDLCATNVSNTPVHLFVTMEYLGCNGMKTLQPGSQYKLEKGKDYTDTQLNASYLWKISHYNHFYIEPGKTLLVQNVPCYEGTIEYGKLARVFTFAPERWEIFKKQIYTVNPKCPWAQPEEKK